MIKRGNLNSHLKKIVIVGGGAAGMELATRLGKSQHLCDVTLIDKAKSHIWKPLLHEVATGSLNTGDDEINYLYHGYKNGYKYEYGEVESIDRSNKRVNISEVYSDFGGKLVGSRNISYDILVLAVGAESNDFGTPGVVDYAMQLNNFQQAENLRKRILEITYAAGENYSNNNVTKIVIVGGGATGVELASELVFSIEEASAIGSKFNPRLLKVILLEAGERILPAAPESLSSYAVDELNNQGVSVKTRSSVARISERGVELHNGEFINANLVVWAAGVKAPGWLKENIGVSVNKINQIIVNNKLRSVDDESIFAIGDCSSFLCGSDRPLPATAQVAHQQAKWLAEHIFQNSDDTFSFKPQGIMVSLGHKKAVGSLNAVLGPERLYHVEGRIAKAMYISLYRMHQCIVHGFIKTALLSIGEKIRGSVRPRMKFH